MENIIKFEEMNIRHEIKKAISDMGFEEPTPIQINSIPLILKVGILLGKQTGTGKNSSSGSPYYKRWFLKINLSRHWYFVPPGNWLFKFREINKLAKYIHGVKGPTHIWGAY